MDRVPVLAFAAVVALIGVLAASSVYVGERNDAAIKAVGNTIRTGRASAIAKD